MVEPASVAETTTYGSSTQVTAVLPASPVGGGWHATMHGSGTQLTFQWTAADQATAGSLSVTVVNPVRTGPARTRKVGSSKSRPASPSESLLR